MDLREAWPLAVAASTCACFVLESASPLLFGPLLKGYGALDKAQRMDWDVRFVGLMHGAAGLELPAPRCRTRKLRLPCRAVPCAGGAVTDPAGVFCCNL